MTGDKRIVPIFVLEIPGEPQGQGRARFNPRGGRPFTPRKTRIKSAQVMAAWEAAGRPSLPDDCFYTFIVEALYERPKGHLLKDGGLSALGRRRWYPGKPDLDNVLKLALDALTSCGAIPDDARLVNLNAKKRWARADQSAGVTLVAVMAGKED